ncbi:hypothetical protein [Desulfobulbus sp.]|uniref:hypothetical protein n=1 Tax=Desulfobulbus sp. TaxID=895 RepID=UPI00286EB5BD|nr:hypothetical protein [Desulfobulbus sp.]
MSDKTMVAEKTKSSVQESNPASEASDIVFDKIVVRSFIGFTSLIGLWVLACLASAMYHAGGPFALISSWFKAVTGM